MPAQKTADTTGTGTGSVCAPFSNNLCAVII